MSNNKSVVRWSCCCLSCVFGRSSETDVRAEAEEHYKSTHHAVRVQKTETWTYHTPPIIEGRPFTLRL